MFISTADRSYLKLLAALVLFAIAIFVIGSLFIPAQDASPGPPRRPVGITVSTTDVPLIHDYKGISLGMSAEDVRHKVGEPTAKSDQQDYYTISEGEVAQFFYDSSRKVKAICIHYSGTAIAPTPKSLFGVDVEPRADGSVHRLVKYERVGYSVSYSRSAGAAPLITVSLQKAP